MKEVQWRTAKYLVERTLVDSNYNIVKDPPIKPKDIVYYIVVKGSYDMDYIENPC
jgi:hypothetical protein